MKITWLVLFTFIYSFSNCQIVYSSKQDISKIEEIIFFGYDFSHFRLTEPKRIYQSDIKKNIPLWIEYLHAKETEGFLKKKMKKSKIVFDFTYITQVFQTLSDSGLVSINKYSISADSIQSIISNYKVSQTEGIGMTIIVECFDKKK